MFYVILTFVLIIAFFVLLSVIMHSAHTRLAKITGHVQDYCLTKKISLSYSYSIFPLAAIATLIIAMFSYNSVGIYFTSIPVLVSLGVLVLYMLVLVIKAGGHFWKILLIRIFFTPVIILLVITGLFADRQKVKVRGNTRYTWVFPAEINYDNGYVLYYRYKIGSTYYYEGSDGTRYVVYHGESFGLNNPQYKLTPLYNIYAEKPGYVRWLY